MLMVWCCVVLHGVAIDMAYVYVVDCCVGMYHTSSSADVILPHLITTMDTSRVNPSRPRTWHSGVGGLVYAWISSTIVPLCCFFFMMYALLLCSVDG